MPPTTLTVSQKIGHMVDRPADRGKIRRNFPTSLDMGFYSRFDTVVYVQYLVVLYIKTYSSQIIILLKTFFKIVSCRLFLEESGHRRQRIH